MNDNEYQNLIKKYSLAELQSIAKRMDKQLYPRRYKAVMQQIETRQAAYSAPASGNQVTPKKLEWNLPIARQGKRRCPNCSEYVLDVFDLMGKDFINPLKCPHCGQLVFVPKLFSWISLLLFEFLGVLILFFFLVNWLAALLSVILFFVLLVAIQLLESRLLPVFRAAIRPNKNK